MIGFQLFDFLLFFLAKNRKTLNDALCRQKGTMNDVADDFIFFFLYYWGDLQVFNFFTNLITFMEILLFYSLKYEFVVLFLQSKTLSEAKFYGNRQKIGRKTLIDFGLFTFQLSKNW